MTLQSLSVNSAHKRYPDFKHFDISASDVGAMMGDMSLHASTFTAEGAPTKHLSFRPQDIIDKRKDQGLQTPPCRCISTLDAWISLHIPRSRGEEVEKNLRSGVVGPPKEWPSTNPKHFEVQQCMLMACLQSLEPEYWHKMWLAQLYHEHVIVSAFGGAAFWYVTVCAPKASSGDPTTHAEDFPQGLGICAVSKTFAFNACWATRAVLGVVGRLLRLQKALLLWELTPVGED